MSIYRRDFIAAVSAQAGLTCLATSFQVSNLLENTNHSFRPPAFSVTPVVGDGKWIWRDPPDETGYLEPREYEVSIGMQFELNFML